MNETKELEEELRKEGAGEEAQLLSFLAKNISNTLDFERSESLKMDFINQINFHKNTNKFFWIRRFASIFAIALIFTVVTVVSAQASLPGQPLYPVKKLSEKVAVALRPSVKNEIITRRSEEVKSVSSKNSSNQLKSAVTNYESELNKTESLPADKVEENKRNLEEAIKNSSGDNLKIIEDAINKTEEKNTENRVEDSVKGESSTEAPSGFIDQNRER